MDTAATPRLTDIIRRAYTIARRDLRACYNPDGIVAGRLHFNAYWARDGFWALFGALALGDLQQALAQLTTFMRYQLATGRLPVRVEFVGHQLGGYDTLRTRPKVVGRAGADLAQANGDDVAAERLNAAAAHVHDRLQIFWTGQYFSDWIRGSRRGGFSADGNVLAILFQVASEPQFQQILAYIRARRLDTATPLVTCDPVYPFWRVFPLYYLAGIPDYHRIMIWPWLGTLNAVGKYRLGDRTGAYADLARIGEWYVRSNAVNEVYDRGGQPIARRFYHAEVPFAWGAGVYVYAVHEVGLAEG